MSKKKPKHKQNHKPTKAKSGHIVLLLVLTVLFLFLLTQLPTLHWKDFSTKPVDLFSDIRVDEEQLDLPGDAEWTEEMDTLAPPPEVIDSIVKTDSIVVTLPDSAVVAPPPVLNPDTIVLVADTITPNDPPRVSGEVVLFEDFSAGQNGLSHLTSALKSVGSLGRPVRIAFLGDSFIEADIFTQDVRSQLQGQYGGQGVGYVSMHSDFPGFRRSVTQSGAGWEVHTVLKPKQMDWGLMSIYQQYFVPLSGATATYKGTTRIERANAWNTSRFVFVAQQDCSVKLKIAGGEWQTFAVTGSPELQSLTVTGETTSFQVRTGNIPGFTAIGVWLDNAQGVAVDNISTRGYSGLSLASVSQARAAQMNKIIPYDAIVLQYGLNVMTASIRNYDSYALKMVSVIRRLQACYPHTDIILMGVGDRCQRRNGVLTTMPAVLGLSKAQRSAAKTAGIVFWDTFQAMGGTNGIIDYVSKGQANKDYTHINHKGGKRLATEFVKSVQYAVNK